MKTHHNDFRLMTALTFLMFVISALCISSQMLHATPLTGNVNVLIVGNSRDSADNSTISGSSDPFDPAAVGTELESILSGAGFSTVNVTTLDRSAEGHSTSVYSLAQWFHYPYPADVETTTRWPNLRGAGGTAWDYVILIGDPYTIEYMPGIYAHGVGLVGEEVAKGTAETVLLMPWPAGGSASTLDHYKEVVYRAGRTGGYKVAPAGLAWQAAGSPVGGTHPSADGAYISAASIFSRVWGQSADNSTEDYVDPRADLADLVHTTVTSNIGAVQYSGPFTFQNPYLMLGDKRRDIHFSENSSSTERWIAGECRGVLNRLGVQWNDSYRDTYNSNTPQDDGNAIWTNNPMPIAWNHGRSGRYQVNSDYWQISYGWSHQTNTHGGVANADADYAAENDTHLSQIFSRDIDFGDFFKGFDDSARNVPFRLLWAGIHQAYPNEDRPVRDNAWHVDGNWQRSIAEFIVTLYSGRCPLNPEPATMNKSWYAQMIGYETAWRVGACSARAPGFKVLPSAADALNVTPSTTDTMTVQFIFPPRQDVTVNITSSDPSAGIVGSQTLVFTPGNYNVPQTVTIAGVNGSSTSAPFNVEYSTSSDDPAYDELSDSWAYTCVRSNTGFSHIDNGTTGYTTPKNFPVTTNLGASGATSANTVLAGPAYGSLAWDGSDVVYTPDADYVGPDGFAFASTNGSAVTTGYIHIDVIDGYPDGSVRVEATDSSAAEDGQATGAWTITREGGTASDLNVNFTLGGSATLGDDYNLSASSPVTIPAGQSSVVITLTPVDDSVFGEHTETATLNIAVGSGYTPIISPATINIVDNDNNAPTVEAGPDQSVSLQLQPTVPGLFYGTVAGNINTADPSPETLVLVDPSVETENAIADNTTEIYTGQIYDADGSISFTENIDDKTRIRIDGVLVLSSDTWGDRVSTANLNLTPGWHDIEIRISNGSGGNGPVSNPGIGYDPAGGTAWQLLTDPGDGSFLRADANTMAANATLNGSSVTDPEDTPIYSWSDTGTGTGTGTATFSNANALSPTVTFSDVGTYVLRLTANDGYGDVYDEVTITVNPSEPNTPPVTDAGPDQEVYLGEDALWTPENISTAAWYDSSDTATIISSGDAVSQWNDKSGNGNHMKQATGSNQPKTGIRSINGLNALDFDGSGDWMQADNNPFGTTINDAFVLMVVNRDGADSRREGFIALNATNPDEWEVVTWAWDDPDAMFRFFSNGVDNARRDYLPNLQNQTALLGFYDSPTEDAKQLWINAVNELDPATTSGGASAVSEGIQIAKGQETSTTFDGMISEVIVIDGTVSEDLRQRLEGYLAHKWGFAATLPDGHPYKSAAPGAAGAAVTLAGSVTDNEQATTGTWSVVSGPGEVGFSDVNALDATAIFTQAGTYELLLTGDDGLDQTTDTMMVIVNPSLPGIYATWAVGFGEAFSNIDPATTGDGDPFSNMMEFAFGMNPTVADGGSLATNGSVHGQPTSKMDVDDSMWLYFMRRKDHGSSGSVSYTVQFSTDLSGFTDNDNGTNPLEPVMDSQIDGTHYEVMRVEYPAGSNFGRVEVDFVE